jgi:hypothetical protein
MLSRLSDRIIGRLANTGGFALSIFSCGEHYPDSPKKIALRLGLLADRVLAALQRIVF